MRVLAISDPQLLLANHLAETVPILIYRAGNLVDTVGVNWFAGSEPFLCRTGRRMSIRIAEPNDAAAIGDLVVQLGYPISADDARRRLVQLLGRADHAVFVATEAGDVVGFVHICVTETLEHEPYGEIKGLAVGEGHQNHGTGAQLLGAAEGWARERGLSTVRVRSNVKRDRARSFYERHGYEVTKVQNIFDKALPPRAAK